MALRSADAITLFRVALVILVVFLVVEKAYPFLSLTILGIAIALDGVDGFAALREASHGRISISDYIMHASGKKRNKYIEKTKQDISKKAPWGPRFDVAGDRVTEYAMWILFLFVGVLPLFVILIIIIRHSFADAMMGMRGTSSKGATWLSNTFYKSNWSRAGINILKFITFSYLILAYVLAYPLYIGYILIALCVGFIVLRGVAEIYDSFVFGGIGART
jgi:phosphatidylglycerophosphate synthase